MHRPVCLECYVEMRCSTNGVYVIEMAGKPPTPYKIWKADAYKCPSCGNEVVTGFALKPFSLSGDPDFSATLQRVKCGPGPVLYDFEKPEDGIAQRLRDLENSEGRGVR